MEQSRKIDYSSRNKIVEVLLRNGEFFLFGFVFNVGNRLIEAFVFVYAVKENISSVSFVIVGFFVVAGCFASPFIVALSNISLPTKKDGCQTATVRKRKFEV